MTQFVYTYKEGTTEMTEQEVLKIFEQLGAVITGSHIVYTSGKHGSAYVNKDAVYPHTEVISELCRVLAEKFASDGVETVIGPAVGGVILAQWVAYHLTTITGHQVFGVYADKTDDGKGFIIKRGYDMFVTAHRVLVVEDVLTTGGSVQKVVEAVRAINGNVLGIAALCNRGGIVPQTIAGVDKLVSLVDIPLEAWDEADCPLCKTQVPINTKVGKGLEFLARQNT